MEQCIWKRENSTTVIIETATLQVSACTRSRVITYLLVGFMEQCMWKKEYSTTVIIETVTLMQTLAQGVG